MAFLPSETVAVHFSSAELSTCETVKKRLTPHRCRHTVECEVAQRATPTRCFSGFGLATSATCGAVFGSLSATETLCRSLEELLFAVFGAQKRTRRQAGDLVKRAAVEHPSHSRSLSRKNWHTGSLHSAHNFSYLKYLQWLSCGLYLDNPFVIFLTGWYYAVDIIHWEPLAYSLTKGHPCASPTDHLIVV